MTRIVGPLNSGAAVGGNGAATASATSTIEIRGFVASIGIKYNDAPPAVSTDVTISTQGTSPNAPSRNILTVTNAATDGYFQPQVNVWSTTGAQQAAVWTPIPIADYVTVTIANANAADNVDVWLLMADD